jgi:hypothetical protein
MPAITNIPICQIIPLPNQTTSFQIHGKEKLRWNFGSEYSRPFFYPVNGTTGTSLVRMGHPGAPNHDHHRGVWFAHNDIEKMDFWAEGKNNQILQTQWLAYEDGDDYAAMAAQTEFHAGHDPEPIIQQQIVAIIRPLEDGQYTLELQTTVTPTMPSLTLNKTNFGFLAVRMAASISGHFGAGTITNQAGKTGEPALFGKAANYIDYSGPIRGTDATEIIEGITYFDHPGNPSYPSKWHIREDGWMGASVCRDAPITLTPSTPLQLRYLLHIHANPIDHDIAKALQKTFDQSPAWKVLKSKRRHRHDDILQVVR